MILRVAPCGVKYAPSVNAYTQSMGADICIFVFYHFSTARDERGATIRMAPYETGLARVCTS